MIGASLSHYRISARLGAGGMGEVYRATDENLGRDVAIKVLPEEVARDPERLARFRREAKLLAALNHTNIAAIHGLEEADEKPFLVLELVEGEDLAQRLKRAAIPVDEALEIARQIAEALEEAHEHAIVHRDLKPANVKLSRDGKVKVLDFGLAKAYAEDRSAESSPDLSHSPTLSAQGTRAGVILGTAAYMSPEQARGNAVDKRADIWAFGVVLYEMLTRKRLFAGETTSDVLAAVLKAEIDLTELPASTPPAVRRLVGRCLERNPRQRLRDVGEARIGLDPSQWRSDAASAVRERRKPRPVWWIALLAAGSAALALGILVGRATRKAAAPSRSERWALELPPGWLVQPFDRSLAFSPDGRRLALVAMPARGSATRPDTSTQLFVRDLDHLEMSQVEGGRGASYPFWSPDGRSLGFFADGKLKRLDLASGSLRMLCDAPSGRGATWSAAGRIVLAPTAAEGLVEVPAEGGAPATIACPQGADCRGQRLPQYLPDGRRLLFFWLPNEGMSRKPGVYLHDPQEKAPRLILPGASDAVFVPPASLAYVRDGTLLVQPLDPDRLVPRGQAMPLAAGVAFNPLRATGPYAFSSLGDVAFQAAERPGMLQLAWFDSNGRRLQSLGTPAPYTSLLPSPDGRRALVGLADDSSALSVWVLDLERGLRTALPLPPFSLDYVDFSWSRDGRSIIGALYGGTSAAVGGSGGGTFWLFDVDRGSVKRIPVTLTQGLEYTNPLWLPDSSGLLFSAASTLGDKQTDVLLLHFGEGVEPRPLLDSPQSEVAIAFSPNGRRLLYRSFAPERSPELYVASFPDGAQRLLVATGATNAAWRSDDELVYGDAGDRRIDSVTLENRGGVLEASAPVPAFGSLRLTEDVAFWSYVRASDRLLLAGRVGDPRPAPLVLISNWRQALAGGGTKDR